MIRISGLFSFVAACEVPVQPRLRLRWRALDENSSRHSVTRNDAFSQNTQYAR